MIILLISLKNIRKKTFLTKPSFKNKSQKLF